MKSIFNSIFLVSIILCNSAFQTLSARFTLSEMTCATQNTISEHKQTIIALGAVTLVGLGLYWWQTSGTSKPQPKPILSPKEEAAITLKLTNPVISFKPVYDEHVNSVSHEPVVPALPLRSIEQISPVVNHLKQCAPDEQVSADKMAIAHTIDKAALEKYLLDGSHYYCSKSADEVMSHVHRGQTTVHNILAGTLKMDENPFELAITHADRHAHLNNIISACWYMYSVALTKNQGFTEGSFIIHDDGKLYDYLLQYVKNVNPHNWQSCVAQSTNPYGYCRHSTHLHQYQEQGHHQYGIDIREGDTLNWWEYWVPFAKQQKPHLPTGKKHILFGRIDEHRTFIKFENDGLYRYDGLVAHAFGAVTSTARKLGIGTNDGPTFRKEHMPKETVDQIKKLIKAHNIAIKAPKTIAEVVAHSQTHAEFVPLIEHLRTKYDHIEVRHGNEVILKEHELAMPLPDNFF